RWPPPSPRRPPFARADAVRGGLPDAGAGPRLAGRGPAVLPRPAGRLDAGAVDQHLRPGHRPGAGLPPRRDGGPRLRPADRRPPLPGSLRRGRLASPPAVVRGRCLLPSDQPLALDTRGAAVAELPPGGHPAP